MAVWRLGIDRAAEWRAIRLAALRHAPEAFDADLDEWQHRPLADFAARLVNVATFASGDVIGAPLAVASWQAGLDDRDRNRGWLLSVFALPDVRRRGHATAAINAALADASGQGATSMGLNVLATNLDAQRLYHRLGFRPTPRKGVTNARGAAEIEMILSPLSALS